MTQIITVLIVTGCVVFSFIVRPIWTWIPVLIVDLYFSIVLLAAKRRYRYRSFSELSPKANKLLQQYGHYFAMPFASKDFSASAATSQFGGIFLGIASVINGFWLGAIFAFVNWFYMGYIAVSFSPVGLLRKHDDMRAAYDEIIQLNEKGND